MNKLSFVLSLILASMCLYGYEKEVIDGVTWSYKIEKGGVTITKSTATGDVVIPDTIAGKPVLRVYDYTFHVSDSFSSVTIPKSVTDIDRFVLSRCNGLTAVNVSSDNPNYTSVDGALFNKAVTELIYCPVAKTGDYVIPNSVTNIGNRAFSGCDGLSSIIITDNVARIGKYAFAECNGLRSVTIPNGVICIDNDAFDECGGLVSVNVSSDNPNYTSVDGVLFNKAVTELICCPAGKTGGYVIPNSVTNIGDRAFKSCRDITSITIPDSVKNMGSGVFGFCSSLRSVAIPNSVTRMDNDIFAECAPLTAVNVSSDNPNYTSVDGILFNKGKTKLLRCHEGRGESYVIPNSVRFVGNYAFSDCSGFTAITIPDSVIAIGGAGL